MKRLIVAAILSLAWSCGGIQESPPPDVDADAGDGTEITPTYDGGELGDVDEEPLVNANGLSEGDFCASLHTEVRCRDHSECNNDVFCDGEERCGNFCGEYYCYAADMIAICGSPPPDNPECHPGVCIEEQQSCVYPLRDADVDGYADVTCGGNDCDDGNNAVHAGAVEKCDGIDNDCDAAADESSWAAGGEPVRISTDGVEVLDAAIAPLGGQWIVAWTEAPGQARIGRYGPFLTPETLPASSILAESEGAADVEILVSEGEIFVLWIESQSIIRGKRVSLDPVFAEGETVTVYPTAPVTPYQEVSDLEAAAARGSRQAGVFFRSQREGNYEINMVPVDLGSFGEAALPDPVRISRTIGFSGFPAAAAGPAAMVVAWEDRRDGSSEIYFSIVDVAERSAGTPARLTVSPGDSQHPAIAAGASAFQVAWMDDSGGPFNIMAAHLGSDGAPMDAPFAMASGEGSRYYPGLIPDPRGSDYQDQAAVIYVIDEGSSRKLAMASLGPQSKDIQEGMEIYTTDMDILSPALSMAEGWRAALWIEGRFDRQELFLLTLECAPR